ncbi:hypothetical protein BJF78_24850 [Pseudonocardia sp. CNS-139]|nr:hypothetical protein BJF78_24850 [Pseudonocardia sp. CNS-139]
MNAGRATIFPASGVAGGRTMVDTDPGYALAAAVLRELDADELPVLPGVWAAYWQRPVPPRELPGPDQVIGGGVGEQLLAWAPLVVAYLGSEVLLGAAATRPRTTSGPASATSSDGCGDARPRRRSRRRPCRS